MGKNPLDRDHGVEPLDGAAATPASASPQRIIADLVSGGVCERFPDLHFNLIEFSAGWLVSYLGFDGQGVEDRHRPGPRLVARVLGRQPRRRTTSRPWGGCSTSTRSGPAAQAQRVRPAPDPRPVRRRPDGRRRPPHHRADDDHVGQRLPARRRHLPGQPASASPRTSTACPTTSGRPSWAAPWPTSWASTRP